MSETNVIFRNDNLYGGGGAGSDVDIATTEKAGIVKPDGESITVEEDGTLSVEKVSAEKVMLEDGETETSVDSKISTIESDIAGINDKLSTRNIKTYGHLNQLGLTTDNTLSDIMTTLPIYSMLSVAVSSGSTPLNLSLGTTGVSHLIVFKGSTTSRGYAKQIGLTNGETWEATYYNSVWGAWKRLVKESDLDTKANAIKVSIALNQRVTFTVEGDSTVAQLSTSGVADTKHGFWLINASIAATAGNTSITTIHAPTSSGVLVDRIAAGTISIRNIASGTLHVLLTWGGAATFTYTIEDIT